MVQHDDVQKIIQSLREGGIILYPTDTIWGLGCDASQEEAYKRLNDIKGRPHDKTYILLVDTIERLKHHVDHIHPRVETLLEVYERPLSIIYASPRNLPDHCIAADGTVAIRVVRDQFCQEIIRGLDAPITSTSPNSSGQPAPGHFGEIQSDILMKCDYVVQQRRSKDHVGSPSILARYNHKGELDFIRT